MLVAGLFVDPEGVYSEFDEVDIWDPDRDARTYEGPLPVVAHPPCNLWVNFAHLNYKRWGGEHNRPGNDDGKFESALKSVRRWGGVLEHPAFSHAWDRFSLARPSPRMRIHDRGGWICEVWQSAYGHKARKRTWLLYSGELLPPGKCAGAVSLEPISVAGSIATSQPSASVKLPQPPPPLQRRSYVWQRATTTLKPDWKKQR